ncbi:MAG: hypothetical protein WAZ12_04265 [Candidatus Absconditicoccaceae bacterium]
MTITIVLIVFGVDQRCVSIIQTHPGLPKQKTDFFTVPILCLVFFLEFILFYLIYPIFFKGQFNYLLGSLGSIVTAYVIYIVFGGTYTLMRTHEVEEKVKGAKKD